MGVEYTIIMNRRRLYVVRVLLQHIPDKRFLHYILSDLYHLANEPDFQLCSLYRYDKVHHEFGFRF
jgi:hypothetical protein